MRKLLIFSSVAVLSAVAFVNFSTDAEASGIQGNAPSSTIESGAPGISNSGFGINTEDVGMRNAIRDGVIRLTYGQDKNSNEVRGDMARQTQAYQTTSALQMWNATKNAGAVSQNYANTAQQAQVAASLTQTQGLAANNCSLVTSTASYGTAEDESRKAFTNMAKQSSSFLSGEAGQSSENGAVDMGNILFDRTAEVCNPAGNKNADVFCKGTDNDHINMGTFLGRPNIGPGVTTPEDLEQLEIMKEVLYGRVPINLNANLLVDPDTEIKNLYMDANRLRTSLSIGTTAFDQAKAERTVGSKENRVTPYLKENLTEGDFLSAETADALTANNQMSVRAQLDAITLGQLNPNYIQEKLMNSPQLMGANVAYNTAVSNRLLFKIWSELEMIKLAVSANLTANSEKDLENINARINEANRR